MQKLLPGNVFERRLLYVQRVKVVSGVLVKPGHGGAAVTRGYAVIYSKSAAEKSRKHRRVKKLLPRAIYRSLV